MSLEREELVQAKRQVVEGSLTLWNARLTALMESGSLDDTLEALRQPAEFLVDNCICNNGCQVGPA